MGLGLIMDSRVLLLCACVAFFATARGQTVNQNAIGSKPTSGAPTEEPAQQKVQPFCSAREVNLLFGNCARAFGMQHYRYLSYLRGSRTCRAQVFDCRYVDRLIKCVNAHPVSAVGNRCWMMIRGVLTNFMHMHRIPCSYDDIYNKCHKTSDDVLPLEERMGTNNQRQQNSVNNQRQQSSANNQRQQSSANNQRQQNSLNNQRQQSSVNNQRQQSSVNNQRQQNSLYNQRQQNSLNNQRQRNRYYMQRQQMRRRNFNPLAMMSFFL